jgi:hypothetical protein
VALVLGGKSTELEGFVDADYAGDQDHRFSTTGFVLTVFGGAVVWGSKKVLDILITSCLSLQRSNCGQGRLTM